MPTNWPSRRLGRGVGAVSLLAVLAVAGCSGAGTSTTASNTPDTTPRGGTLHVAAPDLVDFPPPEGSGHPDTLLDPQASTPSESDEVFRCCLTRTILAHRGVPTDKGGAELLPDLATALPEISADALTWTFHLRAGLHYAPPLQNVEITATDIIRALERTAKLQQAPNFYSVIAGFDAYAKGTADTISGVEAPNAHTFVVHLTSPAGDMGERFSLPPTAPIPPLPGDPNAPLGVATGHDDGDSPFLVSTGPYMIEGADKVDFSKPPAQQQRASGYIAEKSVTLVRNPSWSQAIDPLRPAYVDRIVISGGGDVDSAAASLDKGAVDLVLLGAPPPEAPPAQIAAYRSDPQRGQVDLHPRDAVRSMIMNLAVPPFDDVHVRRAVNYVIDKAKVLDAFGGSTDARVIGHDVIDSLEGDALVNYDPYRTQGVADALAKAKMEMALSAYDANKDGVCDATACRHVAAIALPRQDFQAIATSIAADLRSIGIVLDITTPPTPDDFFRIYLDPTKHVGAALIVGWIKDYFSAEDFIATQFSSSALQNGGMSQLGATPAQLRMWGYSVTSVPSVDDRIDSCVALVGSTAVRCWTAVDQYLTEKVVPIVPLFAENYVTVVPRRVVRYSFDQMWCLPALDQVAVLP